MHLRLQAPASGVEPEQHPKPLHPARVVAHEAVSVPEKEPDSSQKTCGFRGVC